MADFPEHRGIAIEGQRLACLVTGKPSAPPAPMVHGWAHYPDAHLSFPNHSGNARDFPSIDWAPTSTQLRLP